MSGVNAPDPAEVCRTMYDISRRSILPPATEPGRPAADADVTVCVWPYDGGVDPRTRFTIAHDDRRLYGMESLKPFGAQAEPVLRGILNGEYRMDHDRLKERTHLVAPGLPGLVAGDPYWMIPDRGGDPYGELAHSIMLCPADPGPELMTTRGRRFRRLDFCFRLQLTIEGIPVADTAAGRPSFDDAVDAAETLAARRHGVGVMMGRTPSYEALMEETRAEDGYPPEDGWRSSVTDVWPLDAFWEGPELDEGCTFRAWIVRVITQGKGTVRFRTFTVIHAWADRDEPAGNPRPDLGWTINARVGRNQLHALCPLLVAGAAISPIKPAPRTRIV